jgi:putative heme-binding domain-containing protein
MPHIGSEVVDERGVRLLEEWIRRNPARKEEREAAALLDRLRALDEPAVLARERAAGTASAQAAERARRRAAERAETVNKLLSSTGTALLLARAVAEGRVPSSAREQVIAAAMARPDVQVRDLFERFVPDERRVARLGTTIKPQELLVKKGDAARGKDFFFRSGSLCVSCHKVNGTGGNVGPDLGQIGKKYTRGQILESILEPSKFVDPQYVAYVVETEDGKVHTGLLASKTDKEVVLRDVEGKEVRLPAGKVASMTASKQSLMPEQLLRDLTAEQAADLLEFLASLK